MRNWLKKWLVKRPVFIEDKRQWFGTRCGICRSEYCDKNKYGVCKPCWDYTALLVVKEIE